MAQAILPRFAPALILATAVLAARVGSAHVMIDWVTVGAPGNPADTNPGSIQCGPLAPGSEDPSVYSPCGAVATPYRIGKYEVTNAQYAEFLNKIAATDTNQLYSEYMDANATFGGITRRGSPGSYSYIVKPGFASKPVSEVSFLDAARFANWLHNGQPTGEQSALTTEDGAYTLTWAAIVSNSFVRNAGASVFVPSESEWYKAAYYDPIAALYYEYPTGTNEVTACVAPGADTGNSANCNNAAMPPRGAFTDVGAYALSGSPSGTFDQGGNVWEWTEEIKAGSGRVWRGGSFDSGAGLLSVGGSQEMTSPWFENTVLGFRVASVPEPATSLLVLTGLLALAARRRGCA